MNDDFFVGYLPMPASLARRMRWVIGALAVIAMSIAAVLAFLQTGYAHSVFEFSQYRQYEGVVLERPYPMLVVHRPGHAGDPGAAFSTYLLVDQFKRGADSHVSGLAGKHVKVQASLIYRDEQTMLELNPGPIEVVSDPVQQPLPALRSLGAITVTGEIVDSKCYLGVMNPGHGKVHRDCAARCISGGVPAAFVASDQAHSGSVYLLRAAAGGPLPAALSARVGETLTLSGEALQLSDQRFILLAARESGPQAKK